jgi:signal transduction histidine kinase/ligand-binding sensor domain-containing protein
MNRLILINIFIVLFGFIGKSQYLEMKFIDVLNRKNLTSSYVTSIAQDSSDFIWVGTNDGLNRFDGYQTKYYLHITGDSTSLVNNNVSVLFVDGKERLWVGTGNGLCLYDKFTDSFIQIGQEQSPNGLFFFGITQIKSGPGNKVYVSSGNVIHVFDESKGTFNEYLRVPKGEICNFVFDKNNSVWIGVQDIGLYNYSSKQKLVKFYDATNGANELSNTKLRDLEIRGDSLWIATYGGGINVLNIQNGQFTYLDAGESKYSKFVTDLYIDNDGRIWSVDITGLKYYDNRNKKFYSYYYSATDKFTLKKTVTSIYQDKQGNYWTMHFPGGVGLRVPPRGFSSFSAAQRDSWKLSAIGVSAIGSDSVGNFWFGFASVGINVLNWQKGEVIAYFNDINNPYGFSNGTVHSIFKDSQGTMWVGIYNAGLLRFNAELGQFDTYVNDPEDSTSIAGNDVRGIAEDKEGNLWLVLHGKGVGKFDTATEKFSQYAVKNYGLVNDWTMDLLFDDDENLWVASSWGLSKLKKGAKAFENYLKTEGDGNTISSNRVICLHKDKLGNIWVGTSDGLDKYNPETNDFTQIKSPYKNIFIAGIEHDSSNRLWISTLSGLKLFDPKTKTWFNFTESDGLTSEEFYVNSVYSIDENYLMFGGTQGVDVVVPDKLYLNKKEPRVVLTDFKLFYKSVTEYGENSPLKTNITYAKEIVLDYYQNIIEFDFVALNMIQSFKNQYAYQMVGFDKDWVYSGTNNKATYTNLNPGKYTFKVKACNNDQIWNTQGISIEVIVNPPWWKTWWAISIFIISFIFAVSGIYLLRIKALQRQKNLLEEQVENKTRELNQKNADLEKQAVHLNESNIMLEETQQLLEEQSGELINQANNLEKIVRELEKSNASKNRLFSIISHDLRSPFNSILGFLNILYTKFADLDEEERLKMLDVVNRSSKNVFSLLENLLTWAKTQINEITFNPKSFEIDSLLENILSVFTPQLENKNIGLQTNFKKNVYVYADEDMMKVVFRNLISNAIKFTGENGTISIESNIISNSHAQISVKDSGAGMNEEVLNGLFEISKQKLRKGTQGESGSGLGLILCKEFVAINNATISIESEVGIGSTFYITLPLASE